MRYTLSDFHDPVKLLAWLSYDGGDPPTAMMPVTERSFGRNGYTGFHEPKPVTDAETLAKWFQDYRRELFVDWSKSKDNPHRPKTHKQELAQWLRELGYKSGSVESRLKKAIAQIYPPEMFLSQVA